MDELRGAVDDLKRQHEGTARANERLEAVQKLIDTPSSVYPNAALKRRSAKSGRTARSAWAFRSTTPAHHQPHRADTRETRRDSARGCCSLVLLEYVTKEDIKLTEDEGTAAINNYGNHIAASYRDKADEMLTKAVQNGTLNLVIEDAVVMKAAQVLADRMAGRPVVPTTRRDDSVADDGVADDADELTAEDTPAVDSAVIAALNETDDVAEDSGVADEGAQSGGAESSVTE